MPGAAHDRRHRKIARIRQRPARDRRAAARAGRAPGRHPRPARPPAPAQARPPAHAARRLRGGGGSRARCRRALRDLAQGGRAAPGARALAGGLGAREGSPRPRGARARSTRLRSAAMARRPGRAPPPRPRAGIDRHGERVRRGARRIRRRGHRAPCDRGRAPRGGRRPRSRPRGRAPGCGDRRRARARKRAAAAPLPAAPRGRSGALRPARCAHQGRI